MKRVSRLSQRPSSYGRTDGLTEIVTNPFDQSCSLVTAREETPIEMAALRALGPERCSELLDAASADVGSGDWPALVHRAYEQSLAVAS